MKEKQSVYSEPLSRRTMALWLFLSAFAVVLVFLKIGEVRKNPVQLSSIPPAEDPSPKKNWLLPLLTPEERSSPVETPTLEKQPDWSKHIDPRRAQLIGDRFVQQLDDGSKLWYTIDPRLQKRAQDIFQQYQIPYAAAVMIEIRTGRILVLAGRSEADPGLSPFDLCLTAWAPAASIFKVVTTAALLSENRARPFTRVCYHGGSRGLNPEHLIDDKEKDTQCDTLSGALAKSINPIMGKLAVRHLDRNTLLKYANAFGFNQNLDFVRPIALSPAAIPTESFARAEVAAGFWHTNLSPLHAALMAQAIGNRGIMSRPRLIDLVQDENEKLMPLPQTWTTRVVTEYVALLLGRMMVMTTTVGTARDDFYDRKERSYVPWGRVAGKTGSLTRDDPYVNYNWFMGFAPQDKPEVAFAVLLGNPRKWRIRAASAARFLLRAYGDLRPYHPPGTLPNPDKDSQQD